MRSIGGQMRENGPFEVLSGRKIKENKRKNNVHRFLFDFLILFL